VTPEHADAVLSGEPEVGSRIYVGTSFGNYTGVICRIESVGVKRLLHVRRDDNKRGSGVDDCWTIWWEEPVDAWIKVIG
jgi:hypothetical protein